MRLPHSTQRTLPASCSSSETQSEIRRLCVQALEGLIGGSEGPVLIVQGSRCTSPRTASRYSFQMCHIVVLCYP